jgi:hypothetical protein
MTGDTWMSERNYALAPSVETKELQMGWWGSQLSDSQGYFVDPYPTLRVLFYEKAIELVRVAGDSQRGEYPVDFIIRVYDDLENILSEQTIIGNTSIARDISIPENPTNATKIELTILKWSHPGKQAKIVELKDTVSVLEIFPDECFRKDNPARWLEVANYIEVEYQPIDTNGQALERERVIVEDEANIAENGLLKFTLPPNPFVQTPEMARDIADRLLEIYKEPRRNLEMEWRGNPALLLGNIVSVIDSREQTNYRVAKQEIDYTGGLRTSMTGRRVL